MPGDPVGRVARALYPGWYVLADDPKLDFMTARDRKAWEHEMPARDRLARAAAKTAIRELLAVMREWSKLEGFTDNNPDPDFFEEGLAGFARELGLEPPKES